LRITAFQPEREKNPPSSDDFGSTLYNIESVEIAASFEFM
jgi:hypothetical protein